MLFSVGRCQKLLLTCLFPSLLISCYQPPAPHLTDQNELTNEDNNSDSSGQAAPVAEQRQLLNTRNILETKCANCHSEFGIAAGVFGDILDTQNLIARAVIKPGDPVGSKMRNRIRARNSNQMPPSKPLSEDEMYSIESWIFNMSAQNQPQTDVGQQQPAPVDFGAKAQKILTDSCASCHGETALIPPINILDTQKMVAENYITPGNSTVSPIYQRLIAQDATLMPPGVALQGPQIDDVKNWIDTTLAQNPLLTGEPLEVKAINILTKNCGACHGPNNSQGGFSFVADVNRMIESQFLIPGQPDMSSVFTRLAGLSGAIMPPTGKIADEEIALLRDWITNRKEDPVPSVAYSFPQIYDMVKKDMDANVAPELAINVRYFSVAHLVRAKASPLEVETARREFFKALNSLSRGPAIVMPPAIDPANTIYRVNLVDLNIQNEVFNDFMSNFNPFSVGYANPNSVEAINFNSIAQSTQTEHFLIRADWFTSTATLPPNYQALLQLPNTLAELETMLGVQSENNIVNNRVMRSGFSGSGVSANNRVFERHLSNFGYYYKSYDFAASIERQSAFINPLGPLSLEGLEPFTGKTFEEDGGEMIFKLPNGMMAFYLSEANGNTIHQGPTAIVNNPKGPAELLTNIVNGLSCFSCHKGGIIDKKDQVRAYALQNGAQFGAQQRDKILALYTAPEIFSGIMAQDSKTYTDALAMLQITSTDEDPINLSFQYYNSNLTLSRVAAELNSTADAVKAFLLEAPFLSTWNALSVPGGSISRNDFNDLYREALLRLDVNQQVVDPVLGDFIVNNACITVDPFFMDGSCIVSRAVEAPEPVVP